jgi:hypothetical protein
MDTIQRKIKKKKSLLNTINKNREKIANMYILGFSPLLNDFLITRLYAKYNRQIIKLYNKERKYNK